MITILVYTLSVIWSIGLIALPVVAIGWCVRENELFIGAGLLFLGLPLCAFMAAIPWMIMDYDRSPTLATMKKSEWYCTASRTDTVMTPITTGNITVMTPQTYETCIQYMRR